MNEHLRRLEEEVRHLKSLVYLDDTTGVLNGRALWRDLDGLIQHREPFGLLFIDIDYFKRVNECYGHETGSRVLAELAELIQAGLEGESSLYRYGGDEFVIVRPSDDPPDLAERVAGHSFAGVEIGIRISQGAARYPRDGSSASELLDVASRRMFQSRSMENGLKYKLEVGVSLHGDH